MKAAQVMAAGAGLRIVELGVPDPGPGQVRIKVLAMRSSSKAAGREFPIRAFLAMKLPAWWMRSGLE
jgi:hypothetical protein